MELLNGAQPGILLGVFSCTAMGGVTASGFRRASLCGGQTPHAGAVLFLAIRAALTALLAALAIVLRSGIPCAVYHLPDAGHVCLCGQCAGAKRDAGRSARTVMSAQSLLQMVGAWLGWGGRAVAKPRQHSRAVAALRR
ncbi:MAG: hypothetical protein ACLRPX_00370 [Ruthenibacterium sp.]